MCLDPASVAKNKNLDALNYSNKYNTVLTPEEDALYQTWAKGDNQLNRDMSNDVYDYDLRGYWKKYNKQFNGDKATGHLTDEFKKPNHPTFSNQSKYNGVDGNIGGQWEQTSDGKWSFTPSKSTVKLLGKEKLKRYWDKAEKPQGNTLNLE